MSIPKISHYLGMPFFTLLLLSLLGVPRVILHDLNIIEEGSLVNSIFVFVPIIIWIAYIVWRDVKKPFLSLLLIGFFYGIFLAIVHQLLWGMAFDEPIQLGGNLSDLPQTTANLIVRIFAFFNSITTGIVIGIIIGTVGSLVNVIKKRLEGK
ncbi:hypothetical protein [Gracilibacillus alcaliphilus]|uniref:hypothetical protein n=1 Tax=Gracilibacillus alcaliphilus TaxID=1401441 RepID=UPI001EF7C7EA|nr:hypothetical protein [Gracilibacillus alcaliphilus]MBM7676809.1 thiamine transporter ThiT [Gracilibacillus alcaliphilus]